MTAPPSIVWMKGYTREHALQSVGEGWASLIHQVFDALDNIKGTVKIIQVKEKWGGLRIYTDVYNKELENVIVDVGKKSIYMCEICGQDGTLRTNNSYYKTLCDIHHKVFKREHV